MNTFLIVGLGNIGAEYAYTRHNIGFLILDRLAAAHNVTFRTDRLGDVAEVRHKGRRFVLLKPSTYMNLSGKAVQYWLQKEKIAATDIATNLLVILDDLNLVFGQLRLRPAGSAGGHNGLKSIEETLHTNAYPRLRFGIGSEFGKGQQIDYVLGKWSDDEAATLPTHLDTAAAAALSFGMAGLPATMNVYNKVQKTAPDEKKLL